ncbi:tRNA epoxyqueuosine(34) reductase QueG [Cohnella lubricantis]|uniref:Epoxyqueuosine reductase n=1 Tax=Cohnella lubricantis TaxID=2163172 RepID=A0A841TID5_9BACL|nr:tRNA epoxyqueuosine(34) reductase QueG [Cohnella lubricantis]MBB6678990.1 tRNA epoxyqueuosine(34) reductase QueG [Cohnella lubricantis]MBP2119523.1 epoxyqueuosine reductase [Cohnella lubricantis]
MADIQAAPQRDAAFWRQLKEEMKAAAPSLGIDKIGVASAEPFTELKDRLIRHRELGHESGFEEPDLDKRTDPALLFDAPRSIIAIAVAYPSKLLNPPVSEPGARRGILSRSAWGEDYHRVLNDRLSKLADWIAERVPEARGLSMVDTGALSDRAVAERAGIGWSGKNASILTPEWGSWVYLGEMITNLPLPPDTPITDSCGDCTRCIDACPTGALVGPGQLNAQICVSYVTQTKGIVSDDMMEKIGNRLYGCDTCQIVCPINRGIDSRQHAELLPDPEVAKPLLRPLLEMGNREFKEKFGASAAAWRGRKPIQRNALIGLGNFRDAESVPDVARVLREDPRFELRATAAWALGRIGGSEAESALRSALETEEEEQVRAAAEKALETIRSGGPKRRSSKRKEQQPASGRRDADEVQGNYP